MLINGRFLSQRTTGVQRFAREILGATVEAGLLPKGSVIFAPKGTDIPSQLHGIPVQQYGRLHGHAWEQLDLLRAEADKLLVNFCNTAPMGRARQLVMLHDAMIAAYPKNFTFAFRCWYQMMIRAYGHRAQYLATASEFSADEIARHFGIRRGHIEVIPESGEHMRSITPDYAVLEKFGLARDGYFLAVSSMAANKNFAGVLKAVAKLPNLTHKFVIVGGRNAKVFSGDQPDISGAVEVGYLTDGGLRALYEQAACFVYPSFYEGFGLPPLEAMTCGCPVLVSDAASLPEVCGEAALYCDPHDTDDIARQLSRLLESAALRAELREAGLKRAGEWTWKKAAQRLLEITGA